MILWAMAIVVDYNAPFISKRFHGNA